MCVAEPPEHLRSPGSSTKLELHPRPYETPARLLQSKTANVLFAVEATRRWAGERHHANSVTRVPSLYEPSRGIWTRRTCIYSARRMFPLQTIEQGAATSPGRNLAALEGVGGPLLRDCNERLSRSNKAHRYDSLGRRGVRHVDGRQRGAASELSLIREVR